VLLRSFRDAGTARGTVDMTMFMTYSRTMLHVNVHEAKARLSHLLERVRRGERVVVCKRNVPVAELVPLRTTRDRPRPVGRARGEFEIPAAFFAPLPDDDVEAFEGLAP
jgi:prevent-host-death family protein